VKQKKIDETYILTHPKIFRNYMRYIYHTMIVDPVFEFSIMMSAPSPLSFFLQTILDIKNGNENIKEGMREIIRVRHKVKHMMAMDPEYRKLVAEVDKVISKQIKELENQIRSKCN
jgi:hypothetical protein